MNPNNGATPLQPDVQPNGGFQHLRTALQVLGLPLRQHMRRMGTEAVRLLFTETWAEMSEARDSLTTLLQGWKLFLFTVLYKTVRWYQVVSRFESSRLSTRYG